MSNQVDALLFDTSAGIPTNANAFPVLIKLNGSGSGEPKLRDGVHQLSADGRGLHTVRADVLTKDRNGSVAIAQNVYVNSIEPLQADFHLFDAPSVYLASGKVWVKAFVGNNDRISYSITAEKFIPYNPQGADQK